MNQTYHLQKVRYSLDGPSRVLIDTKVWPDAFQLEQTIAPSWLDAKEKLGYPLSPVQEWVRDSRSLPQ